MKFPTEFTGDYWLSVATILKTSRRWVRKSRDSGGNVDLNDQPRSGRPVTVNSQCAFCYMRAYIHQACMHA